MKNYDLIQKFQRASAKVLRTVTIEQLLQGFSFNPLLKERKNNLANWARLRQELKRQGIEGYNIYDQRVQEATLSLNQTPLTKT